jgi:predicted nucleic acid-binding protein
VNDDYLHYLDTSVVLAWLLEDSDDLAVLEGSRTVGSSRLLWTEVARGIHRALQTNRVAPAAAAAARHRFTALAARIARVELSESVLRRAEGPYPVVVRTLDAIHLASAEKWFESEHPAGDPATLCVWSTDTRLNECASLLGFRTPLSHP